VALAVVVLAGALSCGGENQDQTSRRPSTPDPTTPDATTPATTPRATPDTKPPTTPRTPPYALGVVAVRLEDLSRGTPPRGPVPGAPSRSLPVTIYYPSAGSDGPERPNAPPLRQRFPLLVFAHGYAGAASLYTDLLREVASAGFVIAAPDFPVSGIARPGPARRDPVEQAADVSFVISTLQNPSTAPPLLGPLGLGTKVGVFGQSDGGVTTAGVAYNDAYADDRIGAAAILTGAQSFFPDPWFRRATPPFLAVHGDRDETNPFRASERLYAGAHSPKWLVRVIDGSHLEPFTSDASRPYVSALVADFFAAYLAGDTEAAARLALRSNVDGHLQLVAHE
jgi:predicted dienelactone hydrolase